MKIWPPAYGPNPSEAARKAADPECNTGNPSRSANRFYILTWHILEEHSFGFAYHS